MSALSRARRLQWLAALQRLLFLLMPTERAGAASVQVCDCAEGSAASCSPGDDANPGTAEQPRRSHARARTAYDSLAASEALRFCRGGAWPIDEVGERWVNPGCTALGPSRVFACTPSRSGLQPARPLLRRADGRNGISEADGGGAEPGQGHVFEDLDLRSSTVGGSGFFVQNDVDDVLSRDLRIDGFRFAAGAAGSNASPPATGCDGRNERIPRKQSAADLYASGPDAGMIDGGHPERSSDRDFFGLPSLAAPDRGGFERSVSALFSSGFEDQP